MTLLQFICYLIFLLQPFVLQAVEMEEHVCHQTYVLARRRTLALDVKNVGYIKPLFSSVFHFCNNLMYKYEEKQ